MRRALLLFAIVLGLAALAASVSRTERVSERGQRDAPPPGSKSTTETATPAMKPTPPSKPRGRRLRFKQGGRRELRELRVRQAATVLVAVQDPGEVELAGLGLTRPAEAATPASFDVYETRPDSFPVLLRPSAGGEAERVGTLRVVAR